MVQKVIVKDFVLEGMLKSTSKPLILQVRKQKLSKVKEFAQSHFVIKNILRTKLTVTDLSIIVH